ncbi:glutamic acid-rich protein-like isoform X3 [Onthophagus taurus]|uniref:glutamic acid-rich protein-like isoform X3 n=1 Tax=Onthophagus taurus TaxID=166361 RepID=UPI000C202F28|nr:girdin-like isoform X3 [Onthophagus taurus]
MKRGRSYDLVSTKKRFWNPRKWFKRKNNKVADDVNVSNDSEVKEGLRSRSSSELSEPEEAPKRRSGVPMHPGLSVSHDSVFHSPHSGSEIELEGAHSASSLSVTTSTTTTTPHGALGGDRLQTELIKRLRLRRGREDTSEDDEGLPRSPCNSPTATEKTANKDHPTKSHSTCSEGSLISMGSSEIEEDSSGPQSHHSSKVSLQDKKSLDGDLELENVQNSSTPLNHSAAHHRVSVRPSRRYGAPRKRRNQPISTNALPTTLEVNEESSNRSVTPEITIRETVTDFYTASSSVSKRSETSRYLTVNQLKCSSLPPGLASPNSNANKLHRSRSNAGTKSQDEIGTLGEEEDEGAEKKNESFLGKLFPIRRSGKKKRGSKEDKEKNKDECDQIKIDDVDKKSVSSPIDIEKKVLEIPPKPFPRSGPASRQRIAPNDIPPSPDLNQQRHDDLILTKSSPEKNVSPLHLELESKLQQRMTNLQFSPTSEDKKHFIKNEKKIESSQFQKKTVTQQIEDEKGFKSLTNFTDNQDFKPIIAKSHSFKVIKNDTKCEVETKNVDVVKSNSFESISKLEVLNKNEGNKFGESSITISSGPSHKAIVSIGSHKEERSEITKEEVKIFKEEIKELKNRNDDVKLEKDDDFKLTESNQVLITKVQVKKESTQIIKTGAKIPEFMNVQLHKVEKSNNNVVLSTGKPKTPPIIDEQSEKVQKEEIKKDVQKEQKRESQIEIKKEIQKDTKKEVQNEIKKENKVENKIEIKKEIKKENKIEIKKEIKKEIQIIDDVADENKLKLNKDDDKDNQVVENESEKIENVRKFSKEDIEIIEKDDVDKNHTATALIKITTMSTPKILKKPDNIPLKKSNFIQDKPILKIKSSSLDMVELQKEKEIDKNLKSDNEKIELKSKTHSANDININDTNQVTYRRKSIINQKKDDEPELMKVFARRSLKLKDSDSEALSQQVVKMIDEENDVNKSRDCDKENQDERNKTKIDPEVTLRKPIVNNKIVTTYQRAVSLNQKTNDVNTEKLLHKQYSLAERPKTEWIKNQDEIILDKGVFIEEDNKPKNFNQRMAEWEKRAQSVRKNSP